MAGKRISEPDLHPLFNTILIVRHDCVKRSDILPFPTLFATNLTPHPLLGNYRSQHVLQGNFNSYRLLFAISRFFILCRIRIRQAQGVIPTSCHPGCAKEGFIPNKDAKHLCPRHAGLGGLIPQNITITTGGLYRSA